MTVNHCGGCKCGRYKMLALAIIEEATAPGCSEFKRLQLLGELGGIVDWLGDRGSWYLDRWEEAAAELEALKNSKAAAGELVA